MEEFFVFGNLLNETDFDLVLYQSQFESWLWMKVTK